MQVGIKYKYYTISKFDCRQFQLYYIHVLAHFL